MIQFASAAALDAAPIDYSDIPHRHRPANVENKAQVTLRLDQEVLDLAASATRRGSTQSYVERLRRRSPPSPRGCDAGHGPHPARSEIERLELEVERQRADEADWPAPGM